MEKEEFIKELRIRLKGLPKDDLEERVSFYSEIIDDKVEEGKTEDEAIKELGGIDGVVRQIASETNLVSIVKTKMKPKRSLTALEIVLLILAFPIWFPIVIVVMVLLLVCIILLWVLVIVTFSLEFAAIGTGALGFIKFGYTLSESGFNIGYLSIGILGLGLGLVLLSVCGLAIKATIALTKGISTGIKGKLLGGKR
ncbi:MAG: DUF1700 domain-containing protein [Acholeplasmatales bacterium]|nr:DUF1700 domain-containing protein [Acholeplasmatales bacterium]